MDLRVTHPNLLGEPPPALLTDIAEGRMALDAGDDPADVAARFPTYSLAWAEMADRAHRKGQLIESYAYARVGYHRGLDALRRVGWKGHGPIPWEHEANRGFLRCLFALCRAAKAIGEVDEAQRCEAFLRDSDAQAYTVLFG